MQLDDLNVLAAFLAVALADSHAAETERRDLQTADAQSAFLHVLPLCEPNKDSVAPADDSG